MTVGNGDTFANPQGVTVSADYGLSLGLAEMVSRSAPKCAFDPDREALVEFTAELVVANERGGLGSPSNLILAYRNTKEGEMDLHIDWRTVYAGCGLVSLPIFEGEANSRE